MKLKYKGAEAKNPILGVLINNNVYEVDGDLARELLERNVWEVVYKAKAEKVEKMIYKNNKKGDE